MFDFVSYFARSSPNRVAIHDLATQRILTYAELDRAVAGAASVLVDLVGNAIEARVAVLSRNSAEMLILHFACVRAGAIFVPLNWRLTESEIGFMLEDCGPALIALEPQFSPLVTNGVHPKLMLDESSSGFYSRLRTHTSPFVSRRDISLDPNRAITLLYSSGTTGKPKGVIVTALNAFAGAVNLALGTRCSSDSVFLCDMPMFHTAGLFAAASTPLLVGGRVLISQKFDPQVTFDRLADPDLGVTHYFSVPQMAMQLRLLPGFDGRKLAHLTAFITGGAPNPESHVLRWLEDGVMMVNGWGMSEICSASSHPVGDFELIRKRPTAVGVPYLTVEMKVVGSQGRELGEGEPGEIWVRGANVSPSYWRRPDLSSAAFCDGWFRTGDVGVRDAEGYYYIVDRIKDMYISGGENVYPAEIEATLIELPEVREAAVVGVPDAQWGEIGVAYIVLAPEASGDTAAIESHCRVRLAKFKVPRRFEIVSQLPRTASGKVMKHLLRREES